LLIFPEAIAFGRYRFSPATLDSTRYNLAVEELKDILRVFLGLGAAAICIWLYLKLLAFFHERGWSLGRYDASHEPPKVEIQSLFHGNTKDQDQI